MSACLCSSGGSGLRGRAVCCLPAAALNTHCDIFSGCLMKQLPLVQHMSLIKAECTFNFDFFSYGPTICGQCWTEGFHYSVKVTLK